MRKGFIFVALLAALLLSYLFYRSCKRDTLVTAPIDRIDIPDSCWLSGTINLEQIKKDIAWSTLMNGDFNKIFQTDTNKNILLKIVRSPGDYSITEQQNIKYFSVWKDSTIYKGLLFAVEDHNALKQSFRSDSFTIKHKKVYSFRSNEGIWLYNSTNLLFISGTRDSLVASSFFATQDKSDAPIVSDNRIDTLATSPKEILLSGHINTLFIPAALKPALLDSALVSFQLMSSEDELDVSWVYKGFLTETLNQSSITHKNNEAALFCAANFNIAAIERLLKKIPAVQQSYEKQKNTFLPALTAIDNNNLTIEFNGWKKIKSSYYISVMNDEFETVLQKKDSSIIEPVFKISLQQKNRTAAQNFLTYLQKEGLVSKGKLPLALIYGNFDSELNLDASNTFTIRNKHTTDWVSTPGPYPLDAALLLQVHPAALKGLSDSNIQKAGMFEVLEKYRNVKAALLHVQKEQNQLRGHIKIEFEDKNHPLISLMKMLKNSGQ